MARLILKFPYLKGGSPKTTAHLDNLIKYIATRDGVEKVRSGHEYWHATKKQHELIAQIVREFPSTRESLEFEDYLDQPNRKNASEFITSALEQSLDKLGNREKYLDYIANRPRVEKFDNHGLFTAGDMPLVLAEVAREVSEHPGNVWTPIISLRREDAEKFGYESAFAWKALLSSKALEIAESLKIHPDHFKWYAAFHNESHHPHVHMICYSTNPTEGYLTTNGIRKTKSALATEIFKQELIPLYSDKTLHRAHLKEQSSLVLREMVLQMQIGMLKIEKIEQLLAHLADRLRNHGGKMQYGYLKADLKNLVDEIVDELARDGRVAVAYHAWKETKGLIDSIYSDKPQEDIPLSQCEDFKPIRNMVVKEAVQLMEATVTFEDSPSAYHILPEESPVPDLDFPEPLTVDYDIPVPNDEDIPARFENGEVPPQLSQAEDTLDRPETTAGDRSQYGGHRRGNSNRPNWWTAEYKLAKQYLHGDEEADIAQDFAKAQKLFLRETENSNPLAMCDLARMYADGLGMEVDAETAYQWYTKGLDTFCDVEKVNSWKYTQYRIGKMYAAGLGTGQDLGKAAYWLTQSANEKYKYAEYSLGGLYLNGNGVEQSLETAFDLYSSSADQSFPYASFEAGKMLRDGTGCVRDAAAAGKRFTEAFYGFDALEKKSGDDKLQYRLGWMLLNGIGTEKDIPCAKGYLEKSASVGNPFACYQLAKIILSDEHPEPDEVEKALGLLRQSAEADNPHAEYFLGKLYEKGQHVPQSGAEAVRLYTLAAEKGNDYAAYRLGKLYLGGCGILKNVKKALYWLDFAAEKNNQYAQYRLGKIYLTGEEVPRDAKMAIHYLTTSAEQGNQFAQYSMGKLYLLGKDITKDKEEAVKWLTLSAAQGNGYAQFFLDHMDGFRDPSAMLAVIRLLHHVSKVFVDNALPVKTSPGKQIDRKLQRKIREKKIAQGHAREEHEQTMQVL